VRGWRPVWLAAAVAAAGLLVPVAGYAAPRPAPAVCPWGSAGSLPLPAGRVVAAHALATPVGLTLEAPTGSGGWYAARFADGGGGGPQPAALVVASLRPGGPPTRTLARVRTWLLGVTVADGRVVSENGGWLSAWNAGGGPAWRVRLGDGAALTTDTVAVRAVGREVIALIAPDTYPNVGHVVGVDAATGRVNLRAAVPDLDATADVGCSVDTVYLVEPVEPAPGQPVRPGQPPAQESVATAVSLPLGRLVWQHIFVFRPGPDCSQAFGTPYAAPGGLLLTRTPSLCTAAGEGVGTTTTELLAPSTGRVVWQVAHPWTVGSVVSNGAVVAIPFAGGHVAVRSFGSGREMAFFAAPKRFVLLFGAGASIVAAGCASPSVEACSAATVALDDAGVRTAAFAGVSGGSPFAESSGRLYAYGRTASQVVVYRLPSLGPPRG